jgi:hypothetical protein
MPSETKQPAAKAAARKVADSGDDPRQERLARALRDNLRKRKAQQRQRGGGARAEDGGKGGGAGGST